MQIVQILPNGFLFDIWRLNISPPNNTCNGKGVSSLSSQLGMAQVNLLFIVYIRFINNNTIAKVKVGKVCFCKNTDEFNSDVSLCCNFTFLQVLFSIFFFQCFGLKYLFWCRWPDFLSKMCFLFPEDSLKISISFTFTNNKSTVVRHQTYPMVSHL